MPHLEVQFMIKQQLGQMNMIPKSQEHFFSNKGGFLEKIMAEREENDFLMLDFHPG